MYPRTKLIESIQICSFFAPMDLQGAGGTQTIGDWINLAAWDGCLFILHKGVGTAGDDPTITIRQATDNAGTGAKGLNFTKVYRKEDLTNLVNVGQWTTTTQTAANTYTNLTSAESELIWAVDVTANELDADGGFQFVNMTVADVGANAQLGSALAILYRGRHAGAPAGIPSALV